MYLERGNLKFIANDSKTTIINNKGMKVAELDVSSNALFIGKTLYDKEGNSFLSVDISEIIDISL